MATEKDPTEIAREVLAFAEQLQETLHEYHRHGEISLPFDERKAYADRIQGFRDLLDPAPAFRWIENYDAHMGLDALVFAHKDGLRVVAWVYPTFKLTDGNTGIQTCYESNGAIGPLGGKRTVQGVRPVPDRAAAKAEVQEWALQAWKQGYRP